MIIILVYGIGVMCGYLFCALATISYAKTHDLTMVDGRIVWTDRRIGKGLGRLLNIGYSVEIPRERLKVVLSYD